MPGPTPKPDSQRRRRNATIAMTRLPSEGRQGKPPRWPLIDDVVLTARRDMVRAKIKRLLAVLDDDGATKAQQSAANRQLGSAQEQLAILNAQLRAQRKLEREVWAELWATPQAAQWERLGWTREVAQYVRHRVLGELGSLDDAKEARQWTDRLGLTPLSMLRLRWEVVADEVAQQRETASTAAAPPAPPGASARARLRTVDPRAVARG